jgi:hypothetical protein
MYEGDYERRLTAIGDTAAREDPPIYPHEIGIPDFN